MRKIVKYLLQLTKATRILPIYCLGFAVALISAASYPAYSAGITLTGSSAVYYDQGYGIGTYLAPGLALSVHNGNNFDQVAAAGFTMVRADTRWDAVETTKGVYNGWGWVDLYTSKAKQNNLKLVFILCCGNALYADSSNPGGFPKTPATVNAFVQYVRALVRHVGPGLTYEVYMEPSDSYVGSLTPAQYAALANAVIPAIKQIDPTAKVASTGGGGWIDTPYLSALFAAGFPGPGVHPDGIGMHGYLYPYEDTLPPHNDGDPELLWTPALPAHEYAKPYYPGYIYTWQAWEAIKAQYNVNIPTWDLEAGTNIYNFPNWSTDLYLPGRIMVRRLLTRWAAGFPVQVLYSKEMKDNNGDYCWLCQWRSVTAVTTLTKLAAGHTLTSFAFDESLQGDSTALNIVQMDSATDTTYALWVRVGSYTISSVPNGTSAYDMLGNSFKTNGPVTVKAGSGPVYLVYPKS